MANPTRLIAILRKWQQLAGMGRKRISMPRASANVEACKKSAPSKGHFIIYTTDGRRFAVPLAYQKSPVFQELLRMSEYEFGLPGNGPITMPFDAVFMDYVVSFLQRAVPEDLERALLFSLEGTSRCTISSSLHQPYTNPSIFVRG